MITGRGIIGAAASILAVAAGPAAPIRTVSGDRVVEAVVAGTPARLLIDPAAPGPPILSPDFARRAGFKGGMISARFKIGPVPISGTSAVKDIALGDKRFSRRVFWFDRAYAPDVDGVLGPAALPEDIVRFERRPATDRDRTTTLPMVDGGGLLGGVFGLFGRIEVGGQPIRVSFDLRHRQTVATAGAGTVIAAALRGELTGPVEPVEVAYGVERPVRRLTLARALAIGPFALTDLGVRVSDYGNAGTIPDADRVADPDEIIVTGKAKKRDRDRDRDQIRLGLDRLGACASIVFDKPAKLIRLTCS